ncbi:MAG TPA: elongation factor G [Lichenihabitans sp.]|jgi:elongation factor G|nr:elongation factor G [Lichenihabitans sp.]
MPGSSPTVPTARPRTLALVGPFGSGKSTLFNKLLLACGETLKRGAAGGGGGETRLGHCIHMGDAWSILDTPGSVELTYEWTAAAAMADIAVVVCDADPAHALTVAPFLKRLEDDGIPHLLFINRVDALDGSLADTVAALQAVSRRPLAVRQVPVREGGRIVGYADVVSGRAYMHRRGDGTETIEPDVRGAEDQDHMREVLAETLADHDDALLEKLVEGLVPSAAEVFDRIKVEQRHDQIAEVLIGSAEQSYGVERLWKALRHDAPGAEDTMARIGLDAAGDPLAQAFKIVHAGHMGRLAYARVWRGAIADGATLNGSRLGGLYEFHAGEPAKVARAEAGQTLAFGRLDKVAAGSTLSLAEAAEALPFPAPPQPIYAMAVTAQKGEDVKLSGALQRLVEEDPSLTVEVHPETGETLLVGQGDLHLKAAVESLAKTSGIHAVLSPPHVAFRETIRQAVEQHTRLKRQTGGHGQFADVKLQIAPRPAGEGFRFVDEVVGGAVPRQYIPAVASAAEASCTHGPLGFPVVDIEVTLTDGSFHSVDSSDMAFETATRRAMAEGLAKAGPVLLEPIDQVTVTVPNRFTANAQRLVAGRGGRIQSYGEAADRPGWDEIIALIAAPDLQDMIIDLRSQTMGLGTFRRSFDHFAESRRRISSLQDHAPKAAHG